MNSSRDAMVDRGQEPHLLPDTFRWVLMRDLRLVMRRKADVLNLLGFFVLAVSMFPLAIGANPEWLHRIGVGVIWVVALLATMLGAPRIFDQDLADGSLEAMLASGRSATALAAGKMLAAWLTGPLALVLASPLLGVAYQLDTDSLWLLMLSLALGTPTLIAISALAAALTLGLRGASTLVTLLCLPLFSPVLIFGAGAVSMHQAGVSPWPQMALLAAGMLGSIVIVPFLTALALRISLE